ncbi:hypothetical protein CWE23_03650 [Idiomarina aquatica]|uniref:Uncharacterized protein n=1 Tax=Idiomarina aquatica TaxID=1327752 RepID=A0AA94EHK8_9GAMM|nr:hypothetical protein CWE23_03650 [Idiomarina aquatica]
MLASTRNIHSERTISNKGAVLIRARATNYAQQQRPDIRTQFFLINFYTSPAQLDLHNKRSTYMCSWRFLVNPPRALTEAGLLCGSLAPKPQATAKAQAAAHEACRRHALLVFAVFDEVVDDGWIGEG